MYFVQFRNHQKNYNNNALLITRLEQITRFLRTNIKMFETLPGFQKFN